MTQSATITSLPQFPIILGSAHLLDQHWQTPVGIGGSSDMIVVLTGAQEDLRAYAQKIIPHMSWYETAGGTVVSSPANATQARQALTRFQDLAGDSVKVVIVNAYTNASKALLAHAKMGQHLTGDGIFRLEPGQWTANVSDDGKTVTLTKVG